MAKFLLAVLACLAVVSPALAAGQSYSYDNSAANGPANWGGLCDGKSQSPINIQTNGTEYDAGLGALTLTGYSTEPAVNFTATNTGHSLKVSFPSYLYNVSGGGLPGTYTTVQFHLHWGSTNSNGSEHAVDGKLYPAEIHFVSYNTKYSNITTALGHSDGLAVLGVFLKVGSENEQYEKFLSYSNSLVNKDSKVSISAFEFDPLLPADKTKFYRYNGSLTTPTCNEAVTWTVFKDAVAISEAQLNALRSLKMNNSMPLVNNFRPLQKLNNRTVKASFKETTPPPTTPVSTTIPVITVSGIIALKVSNAVLLAMLFGAFFFLQMF